MLVQLLLAAQVLVPAYSANTSRYAFYRDIGVGVEGSRRVFGGAVAGVGEGGTACALLDRFWVARCSGAVLALRWVLTAAHCVSPRLSYVKYNTRRHPTTDGDVAPVHYLYMHPGYKVVQEDEGHGVDVTVLHHDVGLVRTRSDMLLVAAPSRDPLVAMKLYDPEEITGEEVQVFGYGRTERSVLGEELFCVRLVMSRCARGSWVHCVCGAARDLRGVCSGDSGGPVHYKGVQIGVTSMGPVECGGGGGAARGATSVFTALRRYADLINDTIHDTDSALRMRVISRASLHCLRDHVMLSALTLLTLGVLS